MKNIRGMMMLMTVGLAFSAACATKGYVDNQLELVSIRNQKTEHQLESVKSVMNKDIDAVRNELKQNKSEIELVKVDIVEREKRLADELTSVKQEMAPAEPVVIEGRKLLYQVTISDDSVQFAFNQRELSPSARDAVDAFAAVLIAENKDVYVEIQGHTDNIGSEDYNFELGLARAEAVKRYLHTRHGIPLHRISVISYGETAPLTNNDTRKNRAKNRRVVLVAME